MFILFVLVYCVTLETIIVGMGRGREGPGSRRLGISHPLVEKLTKIMFSSLSA